MMVVETPRLDLRRLTAEDAAFMLELLNEPSFIQHIGDRKVRTLDDARNYIAAGPMASYERFGFGLWLVERRADGAALGICGLLKRETLSDVDVGFAFPPTHWGQGYALEAARATLGYARERLGLGRVVAIVSPGNSASLRLLQKLGFRFEGTRRLAENDPEVQLHGLDLAPAPVRIETAGPDVDLAAYGSISTAFRVERVADVMEGTDGPWLRERVLEQPYTKNYDVLAGAAPAAWAARFDLTNWRFLLAHDETGLVGAAAVACRTEDLELLEGREDLALVWDLRVDPRARRRGIGRALLAAAEDWARRQGCAELAIETQQINVPACRLYATSGYRLVAATRGAYVECPDEIQLIWRKAVCDSPPWRSS